MTARRFRIVLAAILSLGSMWLAQLGAPTLVSACSCAPRNAIPDIAKAAEAPDAVVFIGMVTAVSPPGFGAHDFGDMQIQRVYKGELPAVARVRGGGGGDCTMPLEVGLRMIWVAPYRDNLLDPGLCGVHGVIATAEGQQLVAAAEQAFGPGTVPGAPPGEVPRATPDDPDLAGLAIGLVGILVLLVVVAVFASARRRREEPTA